MNKHVKNSLDMLERAGRFATEPTLVLTPRTTQLFAFVGTTVTEMHDLTKTHASGKRGKEAGSSDRQRVGKELTATMRKISRIAKVLDTATYPSAAEQFRVPANKGFQTRLGAARGFLRDVTPIKAAFIERGMPADFVEQLSAKVDAFATASNRKNAGLSSQVHGTKGLRTEARKGVAAVRELDAILRVQLEDKPALLAAWKSASHIERDPRRVADAVASVAAGVVNAG